MKGRTTRQPRDDYLHGGWRAALAGAGTLLALGSMGLFSLPLAVDLVSGKPLPKSVPNPTAFSIAVLTAGIALMIIAANGRRIAAVARAGIRFDPPSLAQVRHAIENARQAPGLGTGAGSGAALATSATPEEKFVDGKNEYEVFAPEALSRSTLEEILARLGEDKPSPDDVEFLLRKSDEHGRSWVAKTKEGPSFHLP